MAPGVDGKLYAITVDSVIITVPVCGGALSQLGKKGNCYSDSSRVSARFKGGRKRQRLRGQLNLKKNISDLPKQIKHLNNTGMGTWTESSQRSSRLQACGTE